ncbi:MAG: SdrD B-like domain-containing protein, partial [Bacteroidota bacterium]
NTLAPGVYGGTVTDGLGCSQATSVGITEPPLLVLTIGKADVLCENDTDGSVIGLPLGGVQPYFFEWQNGAQSSIQNNLPTGNYALTVTDDNGCTASDSTDIVFTSTLSLTTFANETTCADGNDGSASALGIGGGSSDYTYDWSNGATSAMIENLNPGTYFVTVTGGDGCMVSDSAVVNSPPLLTCQTQLVSAISTYNGSDGMAAVIAGGGVAPYSYIWTNGSTNELAEDLNAGTHSVTVTDANGCNCVTHISLKNPSKIGNFIWNDLNQNGIQEAGEPGIAGVSVQLIGTTGTGNSVNMSTISDASGYYYFDGLEHGFYQCAYSLLPNYLFTAQNIGSDAYDSDVNPNTGSTGQFLLGISYYDQNWDCGMIALDEKVNIGDYVWLDFNHDGIQDPTEAGVEGFQVRL